jgi:hypothetical protein
MLTGVRATQVTYKTRAGYRPPAKYSDEIFHCLFGPSGNHVTTAIDTSPIAAPLTFHGAAEISSGASAITQPQNAAWPSALLCPSNGSYVEAPPNAAYDTLGNGDFTIEFFLIHDGVGNAAGPIQWVGIWDGPLLANQGWRFVTDNNSWRFQWIQGGALRQFIWMPTIRATNIWMKPIVERYLGEIRLYVQWQGGVVHLTLSSAQGGNMDGPIPITGAFEIPANPVPLRIGGTPTIASLNYMRDLRITKAAQYRGDPPIVQNAPFGYLLPPIVIDTDTFYTPVHIGQILPPRLIDAEQFYVPILRRDGRALPPLLNTSPQIIAVGQPPLWDNSTGLGYDACCQGPQAPNISDTTIGPPYPVFEDETITTGSGATATLNLPATMNADDLLFAIIQFDQPLTSPQVAGGINLTNGSTGGGGGPAGTFGLWYWRANDSFCATNVVGTMGTPGRTNISVRSSYIVDGGQVPPVFALPASVNWIGRILRFSNIDTSFSFPFWDYEMEHAHTSVNPRIQSAGAWMAPPGFIPYSDVYWNGGFANCALYVKLMLTTADNVLPDQPFYRNLAKHNSTNGSIAISVHNATQSQGLNDQWGSGTINEAVAAPTYWEADLFTINAPFPP